MWNSHAVKSSRTANTALSLNDTITGTSNSLEENRTILNTIEIEKMTIHTIIIDERKNGFLSNNVFCVQS